MSSPALFWIDRSEHAQRLARDIVDELRSREARDELGLGKVRDVIADALAPGTSTIMTRARYYFFVAALYRRLENKKNSRRSTKQILDEIRSIEKGLLEELCNRKQDKEFSGVIGRETFRKQGGLQQDGLPQRLPSEIYWAGLRTLGLLRKNVSRGQYHQQLVDDAYVVPKNQEEGDEVASAWDPHLPCMDDPVKSAKEAGLLLEYKEALYLQERIRTTKLLPGIQGKESLLLWLIETPVDQFDKVKKDPLLAWSDAAVKTKLPFLIESVERARWLSQLMYGAQLLYNHLIETRLVNTDNARAKELELDGSIFSGEIEKWSDRIQKNSDWFFQRDADWFWKWKSFSDAKISQSTQSFITEWTEVVRKDPGDALSPRATSIVSKREELLKPRTSRLSGIDPEQLKIFRGAAGAGALDFRWAVTYRMAADIRAGLSRAE